MCLCAIFVLPFCSCCWLRMSIVVSVCVYVFPVRVHRMFVLFFPCNFISTSTSSYKHLCVCVCSLFFFKNVLVWCLFFRQVFTRERRMQTNILREFFSLLLSSFLCYFYFSGSQEKIYDESLYLFLILKNLYEKTKSEQTIGGHITHIPSHTGCITQK